MLERGYLVGGGFYPSLAHREQHVSDCAAAADEVFAELADAIRRDDIGSRLAGPVRHAGFRRLT